MSLGRKPHPIPAELYRISKLSMEAAELVMPVIQDEALRNQVDLQFQQYRALKKKSYEILRQNGMLPNDTDDLMEIVLHTSIKADMKWNKSVSNVAQIAIYCTGAVMKDLIKTMDYSDDNDTKSRRLAEEYLYTSQKNMEQLSKYL